MEEKKTRIDGFQKSLYVAKGHCLKSLLDFADILKDNKARGVKPTTEKDKAIEELKKRIHNDIAQFAETTSILVTLAKNGGEIQPFRDIEDNGKN